MDFLSFLKNLPLIDLGTGHKRHSTKSKLIGYRHAAAFASSGKTALDMGCGDGFWSGRLASAGYAVTSIDLEKNYPAAIAVNLENGLPFPDRSFDLVWSTDVLEHLHTPVRAVAEIKRVLKPGGLLTLTTPNSHFWLYPVFRLFGYTPNDLQNQDHKQFFHIDDIKKLFPRSLLFGFFPYAIAKFTIRHPKAIHHLSPTFVVVAARENL